MLHETVHHNTTEEGWKLEAGVISHSRRKALTPPETLQLKNRFSGLSKSSKDTTGPTNSVPCGNTWKKQWVIVVGDSLLQAPRLEMSVACHRFG